MTWRKPPPGSPFAPRREGVAGLAEFAAHDRPACVTCFADNNMVVWAPRAGADGLNRCIPHDLARYPRLNPGPTRREQLDRLFDPQGEP